MDLLLILTYTALCVAVFKIFKIPLNKWTVPTAVLGGIVLIGTLILLMNYNHPYTQTGSSVFNTTPIVSTVRGRVTEVKVEANKPLLAGDVLFKIESTPFESEVIRLKAEVAAAEQSVFQLESSYKASTADSIAAEADRDKAQREYERYEAGFKKGAFTAQQVDTRKQAYLASEAQLDAAKALENSARLAFESEINGENTSVARLKALLATAEFNLEETTVRAPTDGYVSHLALRPGMMAVPLPLSPVLTFVHTDDGHYVGAFRQNSTQRLKKGFEAEFIFRALPGKIFKGEVIEVIPAIAEGQVQARGALLNSAALVTSGRVLVKLRINDDLSEYQLPMGSAAEIAVYSDSFTHVAIMRKVLIRMKSWQNYLYLDH
ncbi:HlyD family secretion protein [Vibrio ulleungensis]|uniref:HlyD family secretion protein n=1 Tax=Vibrio ulleungensis TaxID=2807619 RepID=A0ABS2HBD8_9VIBR|nr:HlyD family secretion protein [Vibrio ulleungensis]MBM7034915.1 HlyD family secretion protein [Vibrio ulleungensis]